MPIRHEHLDAILRQAAETIQRLRTQLADPLADREQVAAETLEEARRAQNELLGARAGVVRAVDPATAAAILGDPRQLRAWVALLRAESAALSVMGDDEEVARVEQRAAALERHAPAAS